MPLESQHQKALAHHVRQGVAWLARSDSGRATARLSYAAFELRLAVERLALHYWLALLEHQPEASDMQDLRSFKNIERRIYELGGHQKEINAQYEFMRIVLSAIEYNETFQTPQIGELSGFWHVCSERCHIGWTLVCHDAEIQAAAFSRLTDIANALASQVEGLGWPILKDATFKDLRDKFSAGRISEDEVLAHIRKIGLWAKLTSADGGPSRFVGKPVAPAADE